ncbi:MAG TPA: HAD family phosphatase [Chloroflexota bacterium]|nr:HAD family phosphatase [Chloroflexota bacterium]
MSAPAVDVQTRAGAVAPGEPVRLAFYDFDGTLASGTIVHRYAYVAGRQASRLDCLRRQAGLLLKLPLFVGVNWYSRRRFNELFFREYRGLDQHALVQLGRRLLDEQIQATIYPAARAALAADRAAGYRLVLLSGELDLALRPVADDLGFDDLVCNRLVFRDGIASGEVVAPLLAEREKAAAIRRICQAYGTTPAAARAYSDSLSDLPMLEQVGQPFAVNPEARLRKVAQARGWPVVDWRGNGHA